MLDFMRIACAVPPVRVGDVMKNTADVCDYLHRAEEQGCDLVVFPEMALTGYTCGDLFFQESLLAAVKTGLREIARCTEKLPNLVVALGLPAQIGGQLYNCGAVLSGGRLRGLTAKTFVPNYNEYYERRWFSSSEDLTCREVSARELGLEEEYPVPVGRDLLYRVGDRRLMGLEICEDLWSPLPPSTVLALQGAEVLVNLSASNETIGKRSYRRELIRHQSAAAVCAYAYCSAGSTESTQDLVFSGYSAVAENGALLTECRKPLATDYLLVQDVDLGMLAADRRRNKTFRDTVRVYGNLGTSRIVDCGMGPLRSDGTRRTVKKQPFVPSGKADRRERCMEIFRMQVVGLKERLAHVGSTAVVGVSGGLDSTLALLVAAEAMRQLDRPLTDVYGITMPCFGTSDRTYRNAVLLMQTLGIRSREINVREAVELHFRDIGHDPGLHNGTYENSQARERTQVLMDFASTVGGIVVGTGDLSELALGWCTYNGDHMSMYGVNASIPKTLIRWMIEAIAEIPAFAASRAVLKDILDTPISPELLPPDQEGKISQHTEDIVGPYVLHDFFLYYALRYGFSPGKIYALACRAFQGEYEAEVLKKWLKDFYRRFFFQQFKRSCLPDGVKVGSVCLSPRGDWRMPSDASGHLWLTEAENL